MKCLKKLVCFILIVSSIVSNTSMKVHAKLDEAVQEALKDDDYSDVSCWWQGRCPNDNGRRLHGGTGSTIGAAACSYFATSYMLVKMGEMNPHKETPHNLVDKADEKQLWRNSWGMFDFHYINEIYPNVEMVNWKIPLSGNLEEQLATIRGLMEEDGLFVVVCIVTDYSASGHYIFIDGFDDDGNVIVGDSSYEGITWEDCYVNNVERGNVNCWISDITTFRHSKLKPSDCPSIYDNVKLDKFMSDSEREIYEGIKKEWELNGMPPEGTLYEGEHDLPLVSELSAEENDKMVAIKDNILERNFTWVRVMTTMVSFIGLCLIVYGVLLGVAYLFDKTNNILDISLLAIISLRKYRVWNEDRERQVGHDSINKVYYCDGKAILIRMAVVEIVGFVLVSGVIFESIYGIYKLVMGW